MSGIRDAEAALAGLGPIAGAHYRDDPEIAVVETLPRDHPQWVRDTLSISSRARVLLERLRPAAVKVLAFWDHALRSISVGGMILSVDPSGSYRLDGG
jgi:hypothetical protein